MSNKSKNESKENESCTLSFAKFHRLQKNAIAKKNCKINKDLS